jgi:hypothetical protein
MKRRYSSPTTLLRIQAMSGHPSGSVRRFRERFRRMYSSKLGVFQIPTTIASRNVPLPASCVIASSTPQSTPM